MCSPNQCLRDFASLIESCVRPLNILISRSKCMCVSYNVSICSQCSSVTCLCLYHLVFLVSDTRLIFHISDISAVLVTSDLTSRTYNRVSTYIHSHWSDLLLCPLLYMICFCVLSVSTILLFADFYGSTHPVHYPAILLRHPGVLEHTLL